VPAAVALGWLYNMLYFAGAFGTFAGLLPTRRITVRMATASAPARGA
jgi:hypothetical protein